MCRRTLRRPPWVNSDVLSQLKEKMAADEQTAAKSTKATKAKAARRKHPKQKKMLRKQKKAATKPDQVSPCFI